LAPNLSAVKIVPVLALVLAACSEAGPPPRVASSVRDSAGIRIVDSAGPAWPAGSGWRLGDAPILDLGRLDGPEAAQFFQVAAGARLSDGSFVLGSFGSHDLRRFSADGEHLWTTGRQGQGPGEFMGLMQVAAGPGDTILTYDFRQRRISRFSGDGAFIDDRLLHSPGENAFVFVESLLPDGTAVFTSRTFGGAAGLPPVGEIRRDTIGVHVSSPSGEDVVELGRFPGAEMVVISAGETDRGFTTTVSTPAFARSTEIEAGSSGVWIGDTDRFEIRRYGLDGRLEEIVRRAFEPPLLDDALVQRAMEEDLLDAEDDNDRRAARRRWEDIPLPSTLPAYESLEVDSEGNLWVQLFEIPGAPERTWSVFASDGQWLCDVEVPDRFRPLLIGSDYVLGRFGDELDVEHVQVWELLKPEG